MSRQASGVQVVRDPAGLGGLRWRLARLEDENAGLREEQRQLEAERERRRVAGPLTEGPGDSHAVVGHAEGWGSAGGEVVGPTVVEGAADVGMSGYGCSLAQAR
jgi:hypothetical protein